MRYLVSTLRILVLVAVVLSIASFSDVNKAQAAGGCNASACNITETGTIKMVGNKMLFSGPSNFEIKTNIPTIISGNIIVTTYGALTFLNLTINNGAKLTQETIAISDIDSAGKLKPTGQDKKVDLTVTGTLSLINSGRIDVSAKGFPGGVQNSSHPQGYGPGGGTAGNINVLSGGAYGGKSCNYAGFNNSVCTPGGRDYPEVNANGSGGGANTTNRINGASGGGIIKITAGQMYLDHNDQTYIKASGGALNTGTPSNPVYRSGGGAGGSIWLKVTTLTVGAGSTGSPLANGYNQDKSKNEAFGMVGQMVTNKAGFGKYIDANGDGLGGAGGRINIDVANPVATDNCRITSGDTIPAACEGKDVTVSGTTINMNKVQINGDSKRKFNNLLVENGAVITHEALTRAEIEAGGKTVNRTSGTGRWKKVDIEVIGTITFKSGGKIDVTGKGYPGAYFSWDGSGVLDPVIPGCTGDNLGYLVGADGIPRTRSDTIPRVNYGFGPGGGIAYSVKDNATGGGGSFAGYGKSGTGEQGRILNTIPYYISVGGKDYLDWGSGGGAGSHDGGGRDTSCANGGAGGGIIDIKADTMNMTGFGNSDAVILANGADGNMFQDDGNSVGAGGGAGGAIRLAFNQVLPAAAGSVISVVAGVNSYLPSEDANGKIIGTVDINLKQVSAKGGNRSEHNLPAIGAGGGGGYIILGPASVPVKSIKSKKIEAIVTWKEGTSDKTVKLYDILRSVVTN